MTLHIILLSPSVYTHTPRTHTTGAYIYCCEVSFQVSIHSKLKTVANHSLSANRAQNREAQTSVRSINSFGGRITLANSLLVTLDPSKIPAVRKGTINLCNTDILFLPGSLTGVVTALWAGQQRSLVSVFT